MNTFDRIHRKIRRKFFKTRQLNLDRANTKNPRDFWKYVKQLGPSQDTIPWHIDDEDGKIISDKERVLERWSTDFELLYQNSEACDENFLQYKLKE